MDKLVSIVIPTSDSRDRYLKRALLSVQKQDYRNLEIVIVVDGGSSTVGQMIEDLTLSLPFRLIETPEKVGGSEARNIGVKESNGEFVALLDDDDEWYDDKISSQLQLLAINKLTENDDFLCFTSLHRYKEITDPVYQKIPNLDYAESGRVRIIDYLFETKGLRNIGFIQTSTVLVPRRLLLETPFTKGLPKHQDWDWLLRMDYEHELKILQVKEPKIIYHSDIPAHKRVGYINRWRFTEEWAQDYRNQFSKQGYDSFLLNYVLMGISEDHNLTKQEKKREIKKRLMELSWKNRFSPYAFKMWIYRFKERRRT